MSETKETRRARRRDFMSDQMDPDLRSAPASKKAASRRWLKRKARNKMQRDSRRKNWRDDSR